MIYIPSQKHTCNWTLVLLCIRATGTTICATRRAPPCEIEDRETRQLDSLHQEHQASEATSEDGRVATTAGDSHSEASKEDTEPQPRNPAFKHGTSALPGGGAS